MPAIEIEDVIVKSLHEHLIAQKESRPRATANPESRIVQDWVVRIDVHEDHLTIRLKSAEMTKKDPP